MASTTYPPSLECEQPRHLARSTPEQPTGQLESSVPEVSIFQYYSVANELRDIGRMRREGVGKEGIEAYVRENAVTFGLEFAGMVPHTSIAYRLDTTRNELQYVAGNGERIRMRDSYEGLAEKAGEGSREEQEYVGYSICEDALATGATSAIIISPPHEEAAAFASSGYGLVMAMMKNAQTPEDVRLHIFRYREPVGSLNRTNQIAASLHQQGLATRGARGVEDRYGSEQECRTNPFVGVLDADMEFANILQAVGISPDELRFSALYEQKLRTELDSYLAHYTQLALTGQQKNAEDALSRYFNAAKDLKRKLQADLAREQITQRPAYRIHASHKNGLQHNAEYDRRILEASYIAANDAAYNRPATAAAGGSCPVSRNGQLVSGLSVDRGLATGQTPQSMLGGNAAESGDYKDDPNLCRCGNKEPHFHCPGSKDGQPCEHPIVVGQGIEKCPECGAGKVC